MLNVVHNTSQQLEEVFPHKTTKKKSLHEIFAATIDCLQTGDKLLKFLEAMEINIRRPSTPEVRRVKVIGLGLVEMDEEDSSLTQSRILRKNKPHTWNDECQKAFELIKEYLLYPPILKPPQH